MDEGQITKRHIVAAECGFDATRRKKVKPGRNHLIGKFEQTNDDDLLYHTVFQALLSAQKAGPELFTD